jgi:hypothetical protein
MTPDSPPADLAAAAAYGGYEVIYGGFGPSAESVSSGMSVLLFAGGSKGWLGAQLVIAAAAPPAVAQAIMQDPGPLPSQQQQQQQQQQDGDRGVGTVVVDANGDALVIVGTSTLEDGQTGYAPMCLRDGCYAASVRPGQSHTDAGGIAWVLCGAVLGEG